MKCLIAVKPCGCACDMIRHESENIAIIAWREHYEGTGCRVLEGEPPELIPPFCTHGPLSAQLAAKLREMEAREAGLKGWLRERIWEVQDYDGNAPLVDQFYGKLEAFSEVLAKLEGNGTTLRGPNDSEPCS